MFAYVVISLNEELNIFDCIKSLKDFGAKVIYLLDGGSSDKTVSIAKNLGCKVVLMPGSSISARRAYALDSIDCDYIFFVDADQRLSNNFSENNLLGYFERQNKLAGIQLRLQAHESTAGYWAKGFSERLKMITGIPGRRLVIGTPCVFSKNLTQGIGYEKKLTGPCDDTLFCSKLTAAGYDLLAVKESANEVVRGTFGGTIKKAFWYGMGDAEYIRFATQNRLRHVYHVLIRGMVIFPLKTIFSSFCLTPFFLIFGIARSMGLIYAIFRKVNMSQTSS